jgi:hypothetical protein
MVIEPPIRALASQHSAITSSVGIEKQTDEVTGGRYSPWTGKRLLRAKLHVHVEILCFSACRKAQTNASLGFHKLLGLPD